MPTQMRSFIEPVFHPSNSRRQVDDDESSALFAATKDVLTEWIEGLRRETGDGFPETVTAFREGMAVHGRYNLPCPVCGSAVQRIIYAENETNYCARCQTGGRLLADRSLSRLLRADWPKTLEEMEHRRQGNAVPVAAAEVLDILAVRRL